jgi:hypothetical protein
VIALEPVLFGAVSALASVVLPRLFEAPSGGNIGIPSWLGFIRLSYVRTAGATVFGIAISAAIGLSLSGDSHRPVTYVVFYGLAGLGLVVAVVTTIVIDNREEAPAVGLYQPGQVVPRPNALVALEDELSLAYEEALAMARIIRPEPLTPEGAVVMTALPDWEEKTALFLGNVLGPAYRALFRGSGIDDAPFVRLESERAFLGQLSIRLTPEMIRVGEAAVGEAISRRRENESAAFFVYARRGASLQAASSQ